MLVVVLALPACSDDSAEGEPAFDTWGGTWQAAEPFFSDPAADPVYAAVHELRPEYSVEEIEALFVATADVDYTSLQITSNQLAFIDGATTVCSGRYVATTEEGGSETFDGGADFDLQEQVDGDCTNYRSVSFTRLQYVSDEVHFHVKTGNEAGVLHPPPWNPSVWTPSTTAAFFAEGLSASVEAAAQSLPEK